MANFLDDDLFSLPFEEETSSKAQLPFAHLYKPRKELRALITAESTEEDLIDLTDHLNLEDTKANPKAVQVAESTTQEQQCEPQSEPAHTAVKESPATQPVASAAGNCLKSIFMLPSTFGSHSLQKIVLKAICNAVGASQNDCQISLNQCGSVPSLLITATNTSCLHSYITKCRNAADVELKRRQVSKKTCRKTLLKPLQLDARQAQVLMQKAPRLGGRSQIRPRLVQSSSRAMRPGAEYSKALLSFQQSLEQEIIQQTEALYSRDTSFSIVARFGHFHLQEWKGSASNVAEFAAMMKHPRTRATIADRFGDAKTAATFLLAVQSGGQELFENTGSICFQSDAPSSHTVEAYWDSQKVVAKLEPSARGHKSDYSVGFEGTEDKKQPAVFQLQVLRLGQNIDWMIEACLESKFKPLPRSLFGKGPIDNVSDEVGDFPRPRNCPFLSNLTIRSIYEYQWANKLTPYLVEITVLRSWPSTVSWSRGDPPVTSLGIAIRNDERGLDIEEGTVGQMVEHIGLLAEILDDMVKG